MVSLGIDSPVIPPGRHGTFRLAAPPHSPAALHAVADALHLDGVPHELEGTVALVHDLTRPINDLDTLAVGLAARISDTPSQALELHTIHRNDGQLSTRTVNTVGRADEHPVGRIMQAQLPDDAVGAAIAIPDAVHQQPAVIALTSDHTITAVVPSGDHPEPVLTNDVTGAVIEALRAWIGLPVTPANPRTSGHPYDFAAAVAATALEFFTHHGFDAAIAASRSDHKAVLQAAVDLTAESDWSECAPSKTVLPVVSAALRFPTLGWDDLFAILQQHADHRDARFVQPGLWLALTPQPAGADESAPAHLAAALGELRAIRPGLAEILGPIVQPAGL